MNIVLALLDAGSKAVLFAPYYFNHLMALQMTGAEIEIAECDARFVPDMVTGCTQPLRGCARGGFEW